jgi:hypothetical protein
MSVSDQISQDVLDSTVTLVRKIVGAQKYAGQLTRLLEIETAVKQLLEEQEKLEAEVAPYRKAEADKMEKVKMICDSVGIRMEVVMKLVHVPEPTPASQVASAGWAAIMKKTQGATSASSAPQVVAEPKKQDEKEIRSEDVKDKNGETVSIPALPRLDTIGRELFNKVSSFYSKDRKGARTYSDYVFPRCWLQMRPIYQHWTWSNMIRNLLYLADDDWEKIEAIRRIIPANLLLIMEDKTMKDTYSVTKYDFDAIKAVAPIVNLTEH